MYEAFEENRQPLYQDLRLYWLLMLLVDVLGPQGLDFIDSAATGDGFSDLPPASVDAIRDYFNYRKVTIYGGSSEVQRGIISKAILGL